jgi:hypothetical protein
LVQDQDELKNQIWFALDNIHNAITSFRILGKKKELQTEISYADELNEFQNKQYDMFPDCHSDVNMLNVESLVFEKGFSYSIEDNNNRLNLIFQNEDNNEIYLDIWKPHQCLLCFKFYSSNNTITKKTVAAFPDVQNINNAVDNCTMIMYPQNGSYYLYACYPFFYNHFNGQVLDEIVNNFFKVRRYIEANYCEDEI